MFVMIRLLLIPVLNHCLSVQGMHQILIAFYRINETKQAISVVFPKMVGLMYCCENNNTQDYKKTRKTFFLLFTMTCIFFR